MAKCVVCGKKFKHYDQIIETESNELICNDFYCLLEYLQDNITSEELKAFNAAGDHIGEDISKYSDKEKQGLVEWFYSGKFVKGNYCVADEKATKEQEVNIRFVNLEYVQSRF